MKTQRRCGRGRGERLPHPARARRPGSSRRRGRRAAAAGEGPPAAGGLGEVRAAPSRPEELHSTGRIASGAGRWPCPCRVRRPAFGSAVATASAASGRAGEGLVARAHDRRHGDPRPAAAPVGKVDLVGGGVGRRPGSGQPRPTGPPGRPRRNHRRHPPATDQRGQVVAHRLVVVARRQRAQRGEGAR